MNGPKIVGFIDIGTNSVRLLVVRINPNRSYTVLSQEKEVVRLGEGEFRDQMLTPEAIFRGVMVVKKFAELSRAYGAEEIIAWYDENPARQKIREATDRTTASDTAVSRFSQLSRPVKASTGTVVAKATGTTKVSPYRSHPGYRLMGQRPASYML